MSAITPSLKVSQNEHSCLILLGCTTHSVGLPPWSCFQGHWRGMVKVASHNWSLSRIHIPRCYFPKDDQVTSLQFHGFSDASEDAYSGVVCLRMKDTDGNVHIVLVASKTRVSPIECLSIPRLELCGAHTLTKLLSHVRSTLSTPIQNVMTWTGSTIFINLLDGRSRRFKTYVGNWNPSFSVTSLPRIGSMFTMTRIPLTVLAMHPEELIHHDLWGHGPTWLKQDSSNWLKQPNLPASVSPNTQKEVWFMSSCSAGNQGANCPIWLFLLIVWFVLLAGWCVS